MKGFIPLCVTAFLWLGVNARPYSNDLNNPSWKVRVFEEVVKQILAQPDEERKEEPQKILVQDNLGKHQSTNKEENIMAENDIKMSPCEYLERYQLSDEEREEFIAKYGGSECAEAQDAVYDESKKWKNNLVPYRISSSFDAENRQLILRAIETWTEKTCLTFVDRSSEEDYIYFNSEEDGCWSYLGRSGGRQPINLQLDGCMYYGTILHEIGHALGLDHEQSRPDRDSYITVHYGNVQKEKTSQFDKLNERMVDFEGSEYDYSSIMQYDKTSFSKKGCTGEACTTMQVNNEAAYERQGRPELGEAECLSPNDILQINRLYNCPSVGKEGLLMLRVGQGIELETDNPHVQIRAIDSNGEESTKSTAVMKNNNNPTWNEFIFFQYSDWQLFRMSVWDSSRNKRISLSRTYSLYGNPKSLVDQKYCANVACTRYVTYDYDMVQVREGGLKITIKNAKNIPSDKGVPNPYIRILAVKDDGSATTKETTVVSGKTSPTWNENIKFNQCTSAGFTVQVWDKRATGNFPLSQPEFVDLSSTSDTKKVCFSKPCNFFLRLSFSLITQQECSEYGNGRLTISIKYGRHLTITDYNLYPYLSIDAYTRDGRMAQKTSKVSFESPNPQWDEDIDFGVDNWNDFKVAVWDYWDENKSIRWGKDQTWSLPFKKGVSATNVRVYGRYGFVIFDYKYT